MAGLSSDLLRRCHTILLNCGEFDDHASLQALFVRTELTAYRDRLPQTSDRHERVGQAVHFLLDRHLGDQRPVFPIFLEALRDRYDPQDAQYLELEGLRSEVERELSGIGFVAIPFVIAAMTHNEATGLINEAAFDSPSVAPNARERFQEFRALLEEHDIGVADLPSRYSDDRENWKPHACQLSTIRQVIEDMARHINQQRSEIPALPSFHPQFLSAEFFAEEDEDTRLETWDQLGRSGCVIVVDAVSMFHPDLRRILLRSEMGSNERVAMLVLSPVNSCAIPVNQLIEQEMSLHMQRAFARFSRHLDKLCEMGIGDLRALQRWLFTVLPEAAAIVQGNRPNPSNRKIIREQMGEPLGMEQVIFGQRGVR